MGIDNFFKSLTKTTFVIKRNETKPREAPKNNSSGVHKAGHCVNDVDGISKRNNLNKDATKIKHPIKTLDKNLDNKQKYSDDAAKQDAKQDDCIEDSEIKELDKKIDCKRLYMDFNSILHVTANDIEKDIRYIQYSKIIGKIDDRCRDTMKRIDPNFDLDDDTMGEGKILTKEEWMIKFKKHVKKLIDDQYILESIRNYIDHIMKNLLTGEKVERIFISIDGMPTMAKIVEQKKRRIMTYITNGLKKKMHTDLKSKLSSNRILYEAHVYTFDRSKIIPVSDFMDALYLYLTSDTQFQKWMKTRYTQLKEIVVSSHHLPGEGEKKIMEDIISSNYNAGECVIFSPDADIIIMSMLIRNMLNRRATLDMCTGIKSVDHTVHTSNDDNESEIHGSGTHDSETQSETLGDVSDRKDKKQKLTSPKTKMISKVGLIRYNSYEDNYDYISANDLCRDIFNYVQGKTTLNLDEDRVTNDVSFLFTLLGNDFIPKLEAINVRTDIELILDMYVQTLEITHKSRHFGMYIIYHNRSRYRINYASFTKYFELLSMSEVSLIKERYLSNTYRNYKRLKYLFNEHLSESDHDDAKQPDTTFESKLLYPQLVRYVQFANIIFSVRKKMSEIKKQEVQNGSKMHMNSRIGKPIPFSTKNGPVPRYGRPRESYSHTPQVSRITSDHLMPYVQAEISDMLKDMDRDQFEHILVNLIEMFIKVERLNLSIRDVQKLPITDRLRKIIDDVLDSVNVEPSLYLVPDMPDVKSLYHQQNIKNQFPHPDMLITTYDEELYMMNRCISRYKDAFTPEYEIGFFRMTTKSRYKYDSSYIITDSEEYYSRYFGIDINSKDPDDIEKMNHIVSEYLKGLFWVFNFYMNCNDTEFNKNNTSDWFYQYSHAPLMFHISKFIFNMNKHSKDKKDRWRWMEKLYDSVCDTSYIPRKNFMTNIEYYLYVNPYQRLDQEILGDPLYKEISKVDYTKIFGDLDKMVDRIWEGDDSLLDVRYTYLSRGKLIGQKIFGYSDWKTFLETEGVDMDVMNECTDSVISMDRDVLDTYSTDDSVSGDDMVHAQSSKKTKYLTQCPLDGQYDTIILEDSQNMLKKMQDREHKSTQSFAIIKSSGTSMGLIPTTTCAPVETATTNAPTVTYDMWGFNPFMTAINVVRNTGHDSILACNKSHKSAHDIIYE